MPDETFERPLIESLTRRELEILQLLTENLSIKQIADKLVLAPSSVKWYVKQIYAKLDVNEREQVAARAGELGLLSDHQQPSIPKHNLPSSVTPFIGRQNQIEQVRRMVSDTGCRLVTLTGAGGVGKTRLALKIAETSITAFKHGVWLVELASINEPALVEQTVASVFGLYGDASRSNLDLLRDYLREKKLLLILDNCEHLIDACAQLAETLLRSCPDLHILVTSREALDIEGEIPFSVPSLTFPDPHHLPEVDSLSQFEAVRLFVDRVRSFIPGFSITETNARDIARICKRLDGIPLALELSAARVKVLGVDQIAAHLEESFQLLAGGFRTALPRHQTMRASINWSYQLLSVEEKVLLCRFSIFAGGWTLEAAKEICADENISAYSVIDLLTQLVNKSLVTVENQPGTSVRYYLLDAIWDFAQEKLLEAGESEVIHDRHLQYFLNFAGASEPNLQSREQIHWLDALGHELPNLRVVMDWGLKTNPNAGLRIASALAEFWDIRGSISEGLSWLSKGLKSLDSLDRNENAVSYRLTQAKALAVTGFLLEIQTDYRQAMAALDQSLAIYREHPRDDPSGLAYALLVLASCETAIGDYRQAKSHAEESMELYQANEDLYGISECLLEIGNNESDPARAKSLFLEAQEIKRKIGDLNGLAYTLQQLCEITVYETDFKRASSWLEESLEDYELVGNQKSVVNCLHNLAWIAWVSGDYRSAILRISESISLSQDIEEKALLATNLLMRSDIRLSQGDYENCQDDIQTTLKIGQELGDKAIQASGQLKLGHVALVRGQTEQAKKILREALELSRSQDYKNTEAFSLYYLGRLACDQNDTIPARDYFQQSMRLFYEMNFWYWDYIAYSLEGLAKLSLLRKNGAQAAMQFGAANRLFQRLSNTLSPLERIWREEDLENAQKGLGEALFQQKWDEGYAWSTEEAIQSTSFPE